MGAYQAKKTPHCKGNHQQCEEATHGRGEILENWEDWYPGSMKNSRNSNMKQQSQLRFGQWAQKRPFLKEMADRYMNKGSGSPAIRKMQTKTTVKLLHLTVFRMVTIWKKKNTKCWWARGGKGTIWKYKLVRPCRRAARGFPRCQKIELPCDIPYAFPLLSSIITNTQSTKM